MKKTSIVILIIILIVIVLFVAGKSKKTEAPTINQDQGTTVSNNMPVLGTDTEEMVVKQAKEFIISGKNFSFSPNTITVNKGDEVRVVFKNTQGFHDFVIDGYDQATKQGQAPFEEVIEFTADKAGSFEFYCSVGSHRSMGMKGTLKVLE